MNMNSLCVKYEYKKTLLFEFAFVVYSKIFTKMVPFGAFVPTSTNADYITNRPGHMTFVQLQSKWTVTHLT